MPWYELNSAHDPKLDELAAKYQLHALHLEDCRAEDERIKVDQTASYTFAVLKPIRFVEKDGAPSISLATIDIFAGKHEGEAFFITVAEPPCPLTEEALARARRARRST